MLQENPIKREVIEGIEKITLKLIRISVVSMEMRLLNYGENNCKNKKQTFVDSY